MTMQKYDTAWFLAHFPAALRYRVRHARHAGPVGRDVTLRNGKPDFALTSAWTTGDPASPTLSWTADCTTLDQLLADGSSRGRAGFYKD